MSRRLWPLAVCALFVIGGEAQAQERERTPGYPSVTELAERLDSLRPLVEAARDAAEERAARSDEIGRMVSAATTRVDTLRIGQLTVITPAEQTGRARPIFAAVWAEHFDGVGVSPALENVVFVFHWDDERVSIHTDVSRVDLTFDRWVGRAVVERDIRGAVANAMTFDLGANDAQIGRWVSGNPLRGSDFADVYRHVVTTPSIATRGCLEGDLDACTSAMGLGRGGTLGSVAEPWAPFDYGEVDAWKRFSIEQVRQWYSADERQALIASAGQVANRIRLKRDRCLDGDIAQCDELLETNFGNLVPLSGSVRESLLEYAIEIGGAGAWERVIADPTMTPEKVIEHTAGQPLTDVVEGWQLRLIAARPVVFGSLVPKGALALFWSLVFAAFAMRSTRWRLR